jgi:DNA-binding beta-propeller fold protein YncE
MARPLMHDTGCSKSIVYVTSYNNSVYIYDQKHNAGTPCGQITGLVNPQGIFVDAHRNLWVAMEGNCRTAYSSVLEFAPGTSTPVKTLEDPGGPATDVAVDNKSGTVYVTDFFGYSQGCASGKNGLVEVYAGGSTTPTSSLSESAVVAIVNDAVDDQGNLYVTWDDATGDGHVDEWLSGSGSPKNLGIILGAAGGIATTKTGALLVCDQLYGCGNVEPGSGKLTNLFATQSEGAFGIALDKREKTAWVENPSLNSGQLQEYKYPGPDKQPKQSVTVTGGGYAGVALSPAAPEGRPY